VGSERIQIDIVSHIERPVDGAAMVRGRALFFRGMLGLIVCEKEVSRGGPQVSEDACSLVPAPLGDIILEFEVSD